MHALNKVLGNKFLAIREAFHFAILLIFDAIHELRSVSEDPI